MVEQLKAGRTSIRSAIEVHLLNKAKLECFQEKEQELAEDIKQINTAKSSATLRPTSASDLTVDKPLLL